MPPTPPKKSPMSRERRQSFFYESADMDRRPLERSTADDRPAPLKTGGRLEVIDESLGFIIGVEVSEFKNDADVRYNMYNAMLSVIKAPEKYSLEDIQGMIAVLDKMDIRKNTTSDPIKLLPTASMMQNTPFTCDIAQQQRESLLKIEKLKLGISDSYSRR
jgi:hypothetical protein